MAYVGTVAEVVSACYLKMLLAVKTAWLGYGRIEQCAVSRQQHSVGWYNVVDTGIFTAVPVRSCSFIDEISQQPYSVCSISHRLSHSVRAVIRTKF